MVEVRAFDAIVVGAGFAGMYMLHRLRGLGLSVCVFETGGDVGGTWYWNRYPGARCDIESMQYSYQFSDELQQEWNWTERYAPQHEILAYAAHVADRFHLRRDIRFNSAIVSATFDEDAARWTVEAATGEQATARFCIMATGNLSTANMPAFPGQQEYTGDIYHTGRWPHETVGFSGRRVAIIGTGSSAVQSIPLIAKQAEHLFVFQRTPNYVVPAHNRPLDPAERDAVKADYKSLRQFASSMRAGIAIRPPDKPATAASQEERQRNYEERWATGGFSFLYAFNDTLLNQESNDAAAEFVRAKLRTVVKDERTADLLTPHTTLGCKRLCVDSGYWETFNRSNVTLVDVSKTPIERLSERGVVVGATDYEADAIVFATGFDAMTGALNRIDIRGRGGRTLRQLWAEGPKTYLGLMIAGLPNFFIITGPGSPEIITNVIPAIEQHVEWITDCIKYLGDAKRQTIEADDHAQEAWVDHVREVAGQSLRSTCSSWFLGANIPGKPRVFMPYAGPYPGYVARTREIAANGYEGFVLA